MKNILYVGLHVHKCAGTSLQVHFKKTYGSTKLFWHTNPILNYQEANLEIEDRSFPSRSKVKLIWGHEVHDYFLNLFAHRPIFLFTFLRHPTTRMLSWYKYDAREHMRNKGNLDNLPSFFNYVQSRQNHMCHFIVSRFPKLADHGRDSLHSKAISILDKFAFVGIQEDFERGANLLMKVMESPPIPKRTKQNIDDGNITVDYDQKQLESLNESDLLLYEYVVKRYQKDPQPDLSRLIKLEKAKLMDNSQNLFNEFIEHRVENMVNDIDFNNLLDSYSVDNLKQIVLLLIRQCVVEKNPRKKQFYQKQLMQFNRIFSLDLKTAKLFRP